MDRERCSAAGSVEKWVKKSREALDLFYAYAILRCRRYSTVVIAQSEDETYGSIYTHSNDKCHSTAYLFS